MILQDLADQVILLAKHRPGGLLPLGCLVGLPGLALEVGVEIRRPLTFGGSDVRNEKLLISPEPPLDSCGSPFSTQIATTRGGVSIGRRDSI